MRGGRGVARSPVPRPAGPAAARRSMDRAPVRPARPVDRLVRSRAADRRRRDRRRPSSPSVGGCCGPPAPPTEAGLPLAATTSVAGPDHRPDRRAAPAPGDRRVVIVHVAGAVAAPGVYELPDRRRVDSAPPRRRRRRPPTPTPAPSTLPPPLADGDPRLRPGGGGAAAHPRRPAARPPRRPDRSTSTGPPPPAGRLPGIGPATAPAIVDHRTANGPFASVDDLEAVRGIGPAKLDALRGLVARVMPHSSAASPTATRAMSSAATPAPSQMPARQPRRSRARSRPTSPSGCGSPGRRRWRRR